MALVSHEMRTPLAAIQGLSELLMTFEVSPERRRELNTAINDEAKRLNNMITQYLDITRLESGAVEPRFLPLRLDQLIDRTLFRLETIAAGRHIEVKRDYRPGILPVVADGELLSRAADNLISNAIKYSAPGKTVTVSIRASSDNTVSLVVSDEGYGIGDEDLPRVFQKFYRIPRPQDADVTGTGLGLALVREVAVLHGGSVTVSSRLHVGSVFTLTIPINPEATNTHDEADVGPSASLT
jgi:signal transduction histidine kinase